MRDVAEFSLIGLVMIAVGFCVGFLPQIAIKVDQIQAACGALS